MQNTTPQSVLYIAYHYPPIVGSSGVHRTLAFTRYLAENKWRVTVLSTALKAYREWADEQQAFVPPDVEVLRSFALDTPRHLSYQGRYLGLMAIPDNWQSWILPGILAGLRQLRRQPAQVIVSTYPIASAHLIGYWLHRITGIPWVADFRDPMAQPGYPADPLKKRVFEWIERKAVKHCARIIFTSPGAEIFYKQKFPQAPDSLWTVIPNGYDEALFARVLADSAPTIRKEAAPVQLLHSGVIYPEERDPEPLFEALSRLKRQGKIAADTLQLRLRATGHDSRYQPRLAALDIEDIVELAPPILYQAALREMLAVDGLLLLQADGCHYQIPAKAYEYIRANRPILALTHPSGDTGQLMQQVGLGPIAPLDNTDAIADALLVFLQTIRAQNQASLEDAVIRGYSRQHQARIFAGVLEQAIAGETLATGAEASS